MTTHRILRLPKVLERAGNSRSTLYQLITAGLWTRPVPIGMRAVGWPEQEVSTLIAARIAGQSLDDIRELVATLHAARAQALAA